MPMAASMPCMAEEGKKFEIFPRFKNAKTKIMAPEHIMAARVYK